MVYPNDSTISYDVFILIGIPGVKELLMRSPHPSARYLVGMSGNVILICIVAVEHNFHEPMYLFFYLLVF